MPQRSHAALFTLLLVLSCNAQPPVELPPVTNGTVSVGTNAEFILALNATEVNRIIVTGKTSVLSVISAIPLPH